MKVNKVKHQPIVSNENPIIIYAFADTHYGPDEANMNLLQEHVYRCKIENAYWIHAGDWCDFIGPNDKRFSIDNPAPSIFDQIKGITEIFRPIAGKSIGVLSGNHGEKITKNYGNPIPSIADALRAPYLGDCGFIKLQFTDGGTRKSIDFFIAHGHGGGRKYGGKVNKITDLAGIFDADVYIEGHQHLYLSIDSQSIAISRNAVLKRKSKKFILCPSYMDTYKESDVPNYGTAKLYQPQAIGCVRIEITMNNIKVELIT